MHSFYDPFFFFFFLVRITTRIYCSICENLATRDERWKKNGETYRDKRRRYNKGNVRKTESEPCVSTTMRVNFSSLRGSGKKILRLATYESEMPYLGDNTSEKSVKQRYNRDKKSTRELSDALL